MAAPALSEADRARIQTAVGEAERRTAGEIVPYVVRQSGDYDVAAWRAASVGALLAAAAALGVASLYGGWSLPWLYSAWAVEAATLAGGVLGALVGASVPAVRRLLAAFGAHGDEAYWARELTEDAARRLLGPDRLPASGRREGRRRPPPPDGPVAVRLGDAAGDLYAGLTRQPERLLALLRQQGRFRSAARLEVWTLPRAGEHGPIVCDDLLDLLDRLQAPAAHLRPTAPGESDRG